MINLSNLATKVVASLAVTICLIAPGHGSDWPVAAHDIRRSGSTESTLRPPFSRQWYRLFIDEGIMAGVQPVVSGGKLFIGTLRGTVHAVDSFTGKDVWRIKLPNAVLHSCAVEKDRVFVACADGALYALSVQNGEVLWRFQTGAALWNSPLVFKEKVFFGGRDGRAYALHEETGKLAWQCAVGAPILASPAIDPEQHRIFFAAEDMRMYAFDVDSGKLLWRSARLPGVTFRGYYPVVAPDGAVMMTTAPLYSQEELQTLIEDAVREIFGDYARWQHSEEENRRLREQNFRLLEQAGTYERQMEAIRRRLREAPYFQTFFLLDGKTGEQRAVVPLVYAESMNGTGMPPVVTPDGRVIVKYQALLRSRYQHYSPFLNVGYLETATGNITPLLDESRTYGWHDSLLLVHDEQCCLGVAGTTLINTHQDNVNAVDLRTRIGYPEPFCWNIHEPEKGEALGIWTLLLNHEPLPVGKEWVLRGTGVYGGGSAIDVAITVAGDFFYYLPTHELSTGCAIVAYRMDDRGDASRKTVVPRQTTTLEIREKLAAMPFDWDLLQTPRIARLAPEFLDLRPLATQRALSEIPPPAPLEKAAIERIIWEIPTDANRTPKNYVELEKRLRAQLNAQIRELLAHAWTPFLFPAGKHPVESYRFFADPFETLLTLGLSYHYLDDDMQKEAKRWVERQCESGGWFSDLWAEEPRATGSERRTAYEVVRDSRLVRDDRHFDAMSRLYPIWLWTYHTGNPSLLEKVRTRLAEITSESHRPLDVDLGNGRIAGWIAAARFARQFQLKAVEERAVSEVYQAVRARVEYEWQHPADGLFQEAPGGRWVCARWRNLTPEVARILAEFTGAIQQKLWARYVEHHRPTWWLAWNVELAWRNEAPFSLPSMAQEIFAARALILQAPPDELGRYLDIPWCAADLFYIQKLVWTLQACWGQEWHVIGE
ncbi:MAG: outer membrane protein assembly factor BamB family protein [Thermogutta sp.]